MSLFPLHTVPSSWRLSLPAAAPTSEQSGARARRHPPAVQVITSFRARGGRYDRNYHVSPSWLRNCRPHPARFVFGGFFSCTSRLQQNMPFPTVGSPTSSRSPSSPAVAGWPGYGCRQVRRSPPRSSSAVIKFEAEGGAGPVRAGAAVASASLCTLKHRTHMFPYGEPYVSTERLPYMCLPFRVVVGKEQCAAGLRLLLPEGEQAVVHRRLKKWSAKKTGSVISRPRTSSPPIPHCWVISSLWICPFPALGCTSLFVAGAGQQLVEECETCWCLVAFE